MTTARQKLEALNDLARASGRTRREVFENVRKTWELTTPEVFDIESALATEPEPTSDAEVAERKAAAEQAARLEEKQATAERAAVIQIRANHARLEKTNPFLAAQHSLRNARVVYGDDEDPPPQAA